MALKATEALTKMTRWSRAVLMYLQAALIYQLAFAPPSRPRGRSLVAADEEDEFTDARQAASLPASEESSSSKSSELIA